MFFHVDSMRISLGAVKPRNRWLRIRPQIALHFLPLLFVKFPFHGFIQIGIAIGIAIGIDCLTTNTRDGTARVFLERQREFLIFMCFMVPFQSGSLSGSLSGSYTFSCTLTRDPRHSTRDDRQGRPRFRHRRSPVAGRHKV